MLISCEPRVDQSPYEQLKASFRQLVPVGALLGAGSLAALSLYCFLAFCGMSFTRAYVQNTSDLREFSARELPGFIHQRLDSQRLTDFRKYVAPHIEKHMDDLQKAIAVRRWVRDQQSDSPDDWRKPYLDDTEDPQRLMEEQRQGFHSACRRFSYILLGSLLSIGMEARIVHLAENFQDSGHNHTLVEVWIEPMKKWVLIDATFDTLILVDGVPASLMEVYAVTKRAALSHISFRRDGSHHFPAPTWQAYEPAFKHLYVARTNAVFDGYRLGIFGFKRISFLHFVDEGIEPHPQGRKELLAVLSMVSALASGICLLRLSRGLRVAKLGSADGSCNESRAQEKTNPTRNGISRFWNKREDQARKADFHWHQSH